MAGFGVGNLSLTPLCFEDLPDDALNRADSKSRGHAWAIQTLPSPARGSPVASSPQQALQVSPSPARGSPVAPPPQQVLPSPVRPSPVASPLQGCVASVPLVRSVVSGALSPSPNTAEQIIALNVRCRKAEQLHEAAQARVMALEREAQDLRAKLAAATGSLDGDGQAQLGDGKAQALWKAAQETVGESEVWDEVRKKHEEWFAEAQTNVDQRHCAQIWSLLRENFSVEVLSSVAKSIGEGSVVVGRLLFDTTSSQTASVQKTMGVSQTILENALERRQSSVQRPSTGREASRPAPKKLAVRALSRPAFPPRAPLPAAGSGMPADAQVKPTSPSSALLGGALVRQQLPSGTVRPQIPSGSPLEAPVLKRVVLSPSGAAVDAFGRGMPQSPVGTGVEAPMRRHRMAQSPSVRDRIRKIESSDQLG